MKRVLSITLALGAVLACSGPALAQQPLDYTVTVKAEVVKGSPGDHFLTFDTPVAIPDAILPAGTYIFNVLESSVVRVRSADRSQQIAMFFASPIRRADVDDSYVVTAVSTADPSHRRITRWFLPNRSLGLEFVYPPAESAGER